MHRGTVLRIAAGLRGDILILGAALLVASGRVILGPHMFQGLAVVDELKDFLDESGDVVVHL